MVCKVVLQKLAVYLFHPKHPYGHQAPWPYLGDISYLETHAQVTSCNLTPNKKKVHEVRTRDVVSVTQCSIRRQMSHLLICKDFIVFMFVNNNMHDDTNNANF